jgi:hypothetical protein
MPTLTASSLTGLLSASLDVDDAENLIDAAINRISAHGYAIGNLTGSTPNKSRSVTQAELGWIQAVAVALFPTYQNSGSTSTAFTISGLSKSVSNSVSQGANANTNPEQLAEQAALQLGRNDWSRAFV